MTVSAVTGRPADRPHQAASRNSAMESLPPEKPTQSGVEALVVSLSAMSAQEAVSRGAALFAAVMGPASLAVGVVIAPPKAMD